MTDADLVVSGTFGTASRTAPHHRAGMFGTIIDEWRLTPHGRESMNMAAIDTGTETVLAVVSIDPDTLETCLRLGLPRAMAVHLHTAAVMEVDHHDHARTVCRQLARAAVDGTLPIDATRADYGQLWAVAVTTLCRLTGDAPRWRTATVGG